ncbi:MAG: aldose epimerase family protein [Paracoccaceae bacterium]
MAVVNFGTLPGGEAVQKVTIASDDLRAEVLTYGAIIRDLRLSGYDFPLVLGLNSIADYIAHSPFFGAIVGRCANRIGQGRFTLDGQTHQLDLAEGARHQLHGGAKGFSQRNWQLAAYGADFVTLTLCSPAGEGGYPGTVNATCTYQLAARRIVCTLSATTDAPTVVNLAQHSYFNLDGRATIDAHRVQIFSDHMTAIDAELIPTGKLKPVTNTMFDFRQMRELGSHVSDHNYCLAAGRYGAPQLAARVATPAVSMSVFSTEPGLQFYTADHLAIPVDGLDGRRYTPRAGMCLEPQFWPDAINHAHFPQPVLRPQDTYKQVTRYEFTGRV